MLPGSKGEWREEVRERERTLRQFDVRCTYRTWVTGPRSPRTDTRLVRGEQDQERNVLTNAVSGSSFSN
jgi:hypothetical protein